MDNQIPRQLYNPGGREIPGLQIIKFICAVMVVMIHIPAFFRPYIMPLTRIAVPIFYMITGYFMLNSVGVIEPSRLIKTLKKVAKIALVAIVAYIIYSEWLYSRHPEIRVFPFFSVDYWVRMLLFGSLPWVHLWYLVALLEAVVILWIAVKFRFLRWLYIFIPIGLAANLILGRYSFLFDGLVENNIDYSRNVFTTALPCILIGMLIRRYEHLAPQTRYIWLAALIGVCCIYIESLVFLYQFKPLVGDIIFFTIPCAVAVFLLFIRFDVDNSVTRCMGRWGKYYSLDIYVWHVIVSGFLITTFTKLGLGGIMSIIAVVATLLFAMFLRRTRLNRFYS